MTAPAEPSMTQAALGPTDPAGPAKPLVDPVPPPQASAAVAVPRSEPPELAIAATPDLAVQQIPPQPSIAAALSMSAAAADPEAGRDLFAMIAESRVALARGVESVTDELASFARHSIDATADTAIQMLAATTWSDALAVNAKFARTSYDRWFDSTAKVSELGVKLAYESSKPFISRFGRIWGGAADGG